MTNIDSRVAATILASSPDLFEKSEKRSWYLLFTHALNFPTFWEFQIIPCYLHVPRCQVCVLCRIFNRTLLTMAICVQGLDSAMLYAWVVSPWGSAKPYPLNVKVMVLTATATSSTQKEIMKRLDMKKAVVVYLLPSKPNIVYVVMNTMTDYWRHSATYFQKTSCKRCGHRQKICILSDIQSSSTVFIKF